MGFQDILGHERQKGILQNAILRDKVHHAWLLVGPQGVGRRTLAQTFAKALNCEKQDGDACDKCLSCHKISNGIHPDFKKVGDDRTAAQIKIDEVREHILRFVTLRIYEARYRVILVQDAERMNANTANALLKTLEEPPPRTVLLLTAPSLNALLPTIRSRCQKVRLSPVEEHALAKWLVEHHSHTPDQALLLARLAEGSVGRAVALTPEQLVGRTQFLTAMMKVSSSQVADPLAVAEQLNPDRQGLLAYLDTLESLWRDVAVAQVAPQALLRNADFSSQIADFAQRTPSRTVHQLMASVAEARVAIKLNINPQNILEHLLLEMSRVQRATHGQALRRAS